MKRIILKGIFQLPLICILLKGIKVSFDVGTIGGMLIGITLIIAYDIAGLHFGE